MDGHAPRPLEIPRQLVLNSATKFDTLGASLVYQHDLLAEP